ncbi:MAG TPA: hypothetical protein VHD33_04330, partial [Legionellaceae bacterium]|nr:hypothetical protein [Legionellaceae bacterium]
FKGDLSRYKEALEELGENTEEKIKEDCNFMKEWMESADNIDLDTHNYSDTIMQQLKILQTIAKDFKIEKKQLETQSSSGKTYSH